MVEFGRARLGLFCSFHEFGFFVVVVVLRVPAGGVRDVRDGRVACEIDVAEL